MSNVASKAVRTPHYRICSEVHQDFVYAFLGMIASATAVAVSIVLIARTVGSLGIGIASALGLSAIAFGGLGMLVTVRRETLKRHLGRIALDVALGAAIYVLLLATLFSRSVLTAPAYSVALFLGAVSEEFVFRVALPNRFMSELRSAQWFGRSASGFAWLASQVVFAICHAIPSSVGRASIDSNEFLRLTTAGLLFAVVVTRAGVPLAAALHASFNFRLHFGFIVEQSVPTTSMLIAGALFALCVLVLHPAFASDALPVAVLVPPPPPGATHVTRS